MRTGNGDPSTQRLAVFDLDKTLLDGESRISNACANRLRAAMVPGLECTVASGRDMERIEPYLKQMGWTSVPVIAEQGAVIVAPQTRAILMERTISRGNLATALEAVRGSGIPANVALFGRDGPQMYHMADTPALPRWPGYGPDPVEIRDLGDARILRGTHVRKLSLRCFPQDTDRMRSLITAALGERATVVKADVDFVNVTDCGVNKGSALAWLISHLGIDPWNVMAVGDCEADWSMFAVAGVSVAVANADEKTRSIAHFVAASNEECGAAAALVQFATGGYDI